ncbi:MAG: hypothetical protein M3P93_03125 [Actinomycetota bacterium]|nr:hypothetical protein [Actinomycetota bacterium]
MSTLGVSCTTACAFLALADGETVAPVPDRLEPAAGLGPEEQLPVFAEDVARVLRDCGGDRVVILQAEPRYEAGHTAWVPRLAMETLVRLESVRAGVPCSYISRQKVKGSLGLKGRGGLDALGKDELASAGMYWSAGRLVAALAAVAAERDAEAG